MQRSFGNRWIEKHYHVIIKVLTLSSVIILILQRCFISIRDVDFGFDERVITNDEF